jgi:hypothetical protein
MILKNNDKLVYEAYGLSPDDVQEVENWYARRYSKLAPPKRPTCGLWARAMIIWNYMGLNNCCPLKEYV